MNTFPIDCSDVSWFGTDLLCRTPEALEVALKTLRDIGYDVKDCRLDPEIGRLRQMTAEEMERDGDSLWFAALDTRRYKCNSCLQYIDNRGIESHGHECERCGSVTYYDMPEGAIVRFQFRSRNVQSIFQQMEFKVIHWDVTGGWLYTEPYPYENEVHSFVLRRAEAWRYMDEHRDKWERIEYNGEPALKLRYVRQSGTEDRSSNAIELTHVSGSIKNYSIVRVWKDVEYPEYGNDIPLPETIHVYEGWHKGTAKSS